MLQTLLTLMEEDMQLAIVSAVLNTHMLPLFLTHKEHKQQATHTTQTNSLLINY